MRFTAARSAKLLALLMLAPVVLTAHTDSQPSQATAHSKRAHATRSRYIVQSASAPAARASVVRVGGEVKQQLAIINAVAAELSTAQADELRSIMGVRLFADRSLAPMGAAPAGTLLPVLTDGTAVTAHHANDIETNYPMLVGADTMQKAGVTGKGVTIAVLDTGLWIGGGQKFNVIASVDVVGGGTHSLAGDAFGHGTHVASIAAGGALTKAGTYFGVAPQANLVIVRAFDQDGAGSYTDVIAGLNWIVANRQKYKIRVLNLSFGAPPQSNYWDDPLNQAVMAAWKAGIVVVASAGNEGPSPMTIGVPGNVPYVITAGALTDNRTPYDATDDRLASFSSTGPTYEGFVKPEVVAPGGHMVGSMSYQSYLANIHPGSMNKDNSLFVMSGTSQAAAVTSGVVALMIQADPTLTPDTVKCRLLASASPAITAERTLAYSIFQQGAGLINAVNAIHSSATGCANRGLNIAADLAGTEHFGGPANQDANGNYYVMNMSASTWGMPVSGDGYTWTQGYTWTKGYTWTQGYTWTNGYTWTQGYTWTKGYTWTAGYTWSKGYTWSNLLPWWGTVGTARGTSTPASIESWVPNQ